MIGPLVTDMIGPEEFLPIDMSDSEVKVKPLPALIGVPSQSHELTVKLPAVLMKTEPVAPMPLTNRLLELLLT